MNDYPSRRMTIYTGQSLLYRLFIGLLLCALLVIVFLIPAHYLWQKNLTEAMNKAVIAGDLPEVQRLVADHPFLVNAVVTDVMVRSSMLRVAVVNRHYAVAEFLIKKGADVNYKDFSDRTPLHKAAERGDQRMVRLLLSHHALPNTKDRIGYTPLHSAASLEDPLIARLLLDAGADPNIKNEDGKTPIDEARRLHCSRTLKTLIHYSGANQLH